MAGSDVADETGISAQVTVVGNESGGEQLRANPGPRIGGDALDIERSIRSLLAARKISRITGAS